MFFPESAIPVVVVVLREIQMLRTSRKKRFVEGIANFEERCDAAEQLQHCDRYIDRGYWQFLICSFVSGLLRSIVSARIDKFWVQSHRPQQAKCPLARTRRIQMETGYRSAKREAVIQLMEETEESTWNNTMR